MLGAMVFMGYAGGLLGRWKFFSIFELYGYSDGALQTSNNKGEVRWWWWVVLVGKAFSLFFSQLCGVVYL